MVLLGGALTDALTTPLWKWTHSLTVEAATTAPTSTGVQYVDVAQQAGLTIPNVWGGVKHKRSIIETKGSGLAFFDYDNDGWLDIYITNGNRLDTTWPKGEAPISHLYKNNRDGTFTNVTEGSGLGITGWQTGVCVGDYNNDGWDDLFCCFLGHNILFHNNGNGTFTDVTRKAGLCQEKGRWGAGCTFLDYDRDSHLDLFVCNYIRTGFLLPTRQSFVSGRGSRSCVVPADFPAIPTSSITTMGTEPLPTCRRNQEFWSPDLDTPSPPYRTISIMMGGRIFISP
jgi:hypothetical protein